jgi:hypothetical protein
LAFQPFQMVTTENGANLDYMDTDGEITPQHYAFLVSEAEFDEIFDRIRERHLSYWADPSRTQPGEINHHDGGRGIYFEEPNGHLLEIMTRQCQAATQRSMQFDCSHGGNDAFSFQGLD